MGDTIEIKGGAILKDNLKDRVDFDKTYEISSSISNGICEIFIKQETKLEPDLERTSTKIKSELQEEPISDAAIGSEIHNFPPELVICKSYTAVCSHNETDARTDIKEEHDGWLETTSRSEEFPAPDFELQNNSKPQDTINGKEGEFSSLESPRSMSKSTLRTPRGSWSGESMKKAIDQVVAGKIGLRDAAKRFGVPRSSLHDRVTQIRNGVHVNILPKLGRFKPTFIGMEEKLVQYMQELDSCLMPLTRKEFLKLAYDLAEKLRIDHRFNKDKKTAGKHFYKSFMERHPKLALRIESTSRMQCVGFNKQQVEQFYSKLEDLMKCHAFPPSRIYNVGETEVSSLQKVLTKGKRQAGNLMSAGSGKNIIMAFAMNPVGHFIPPVFIFPRKIMHARLMRGAPEESVGFAQENGWMNGETFLLWLGHFAKHVQPGDNDPVLLILDGRGSHKELQVILSAREHNIHMLSFPPNTSHKLQPLDCTFMKPFKDCVSKEMAVWMKKNAGQRITDSNMAGIASAAFNKVCCPDIAKNGFHYTGIYPFNPDTFSDMDFLPCRETDVSENQLLVPCMTSEISVNHCDQLKNQNSPSNIHNRKHTEITNDVSDALHKLSSLPDTSRKRKPQNSEVLTSSPCKDMVMIKMKEPKQDKKKQTGSFIFKVINPSS